MKFLMTIALSIGLITTSQALQEYHVKTFTTLEESHLLRGDIINYQVKTSALQYDEVDAQHFMPLVEQRVTNHLDALNEGKRVLVTIWNKENELSGISWLYQSSQCTRICQSNCTDPQVYGLFLKAALEQFPEATHIQTIVNKKRPLLNTLLPQLGWKNIPVYDLEDNHNEDDYAAFQISQKDVPESLRKMHEYMKRKSQK